MIQRQTLEQIDITLHNLEKIIRKFSDLLLSEVEQIKNSDDIDIFEVIRGGKLIADTIEKLVVVSPFLVFRNDFEAVERLKEWLTESTQFVGDKRSEMLQMLFLYQTELINQVDNNSSGQMTLI